MVSYAAATSPFVRLQWVLILVVVEDGLVPGINSQLDNKDRRLNPCCSGRWSRTDATNQSTNIRLMVLILVVVEDGLVRVQQLLSSLK